MKGNELHLRPGILESQKPIEGVRLMADRRAWAWTARALALVVAVVIPACTRNGGTTTNGLLWSSNSVSPAGGAPGPAQLQWNPPNSAIPGPIGIIGIGGVEITFGDADPATYPPGTPEAPHPVSTSRSLDPNAEAVVNSLVQQLFQPNVNQGGNGQVNTGPSLLTGDTKLAALSRAFAKHRTFHTGALGGVNLQTRFGWVGGNPNATALVEYHAAGAGMTPQQAGNNIAAQANAYVQAITQNAFGAAGYWTGGVDNYYTFSMCQVANGAP
jgi:hypothetical protein